MPSDPNDPNRKNDVSPVTGNSEKQAQADAAQSKEVMQQDAVKTSPPAAKITRQQN
jgi:hypothetical protein